MAATTNGSGHSNGLYKVRNQGDKAYSLGVPREVGEKIAGRSFLFNLTDDGILFTPVATNRNPMQDQIEQTSWVTA